MHNGNLGFGGLNPCSQTHGSKKFYSAGQNDPMSTLLSGNYTKVPIMTGAVFNDGYLIVQQTYDYLLKPDNLHHDEHFLKYKIIDQMTESFAMDLGYAFKKEIQNSYFYPSEMGNFDQMIPSDSKLVQSIYYILCLAAAFLYVIGLTLIDLAPC